MNLLFLFGIFLFWPRQLRDVPVLEVRGDLGFFGLLEFPAGGAGSEVWNRVYMIAPVKKFGRVRLSINFHSKQIWRRMQTWKDDEFLLSFKFSRVQTSRKGFHELF